MADYSNVYSYDNLGRLTQVVQRQFSSGEQTTYGATSTNTLTRKRVNLAYNSAGQFAKIIRMSGASGAETETATSVYDYFNGEPHVTHRDRHRPVRLVLAPQPYTLQACVLRVRADVD